MSGIYQRTEEELVRLRTMNIGRKQSRRLDVRAKISKSGKGRKFSDESREKMRLAHLGKMTGGANPNKRPEVKQKISDTKRAKREANLK